MVGLAGWFTILASSMVAITKDDIKARLAYSTISQLYIVLGAPFIIACCAGRIAYRDDAAGKSRYSSVLVHFMCRRM